MCRITNEENANQRKGLNVFMESSFMKTMSYITVGVIFFTLFTNLFYEQNVPNGSFMKQTRFGEAIGSIGSNLDSYGNFAYLISIFIAVRVNRPLHRLRCPQKTPSYYNVIVHNPASI